MTQLTAGDRLGERAVQRGHEDELGAVAQAVLAQPVVGEEGELQRRDGALDGHLGDVDDQASALEGGEVVAQRERAVEGVELVDAPVPSSPSIPGVWSGRGVVPEAMTR